MRKQVSDNDGIEYCKQCMNHFGSKEFLEKHKISATNISLNFRNVKKKGSLLNFLNFIRKILVPFVVCADLECILVPKATCSPNSKNSYTKQLHEHKPCSFYYIIKCFDGDVMVPIERHYTGEDAEEVFINWLVRVLKEIQKKYHQNLAPVKNNETAGRGVQKSC